MMDLNYTAIFLISFIPLLIGYFWYQPDSKISKWSKVTTVLPSEIGAGKAVVLFLLSMGIVYGYMNLIIHQLGFYELFFTDLMMGKEDAKVIVSEFLGEYGKKHRHFGHGVLHGMINAFTFALPFVYVHAILENRDVKYVIHHFGFWLITSIVIGGLISEFV